MYNHEQREHSCYLATAMSMPNSTTVFDEMSTGWFLAPNCGKMEVILYAKTQTVVANAKTVQINMYTAPSLGGSYTLQKCVASYLTTAETTWAVGAEILRFTIPQDVAGYWLKFYISTADSGVTGTFDAIVHQNT